MKRPYPTLLLAICLTAPAAAQDDPAQSADLRDLRAELKQTQQQLLELTRKIERLTRDEADLLRAPRSFGLRNEERPMVGIIMSPTANRDGVRLAGVTPDGPADRAGLRSGDRIVAIDGQSLDGRDAVDRAYDLLEGMQTGDQYEFTYERDGESRSVTVTAELHRPSWSYSYRFELPDLHLGEDFRFGLDQNLERDLEQLKEQTDRFGDWHWDYRKLPGGAYLWGFGFAWSGLELARLNPQLARYFGADEGVLVIDSDLSDSDLQGGDVIVAIDGEPVGDPKHAMRLLGRFQAGAQIPVRVIRDRAERQVTLVAPRAAAPEINVLLRDENA